MPPRNDSHTCDPAAIGGADDDDAPLECEYLVVGAGASGMAFADTILTENRTATVILVDRNDGPGGHWRHAYPFCRLHQTSCNYGVNSLTLGRSIDGRGNERYDVTDRATGAEVVEYYEAACKQLEGSGRFKPFFGAEYDSMDEDRGVHLVRCRGDDSSTAVKCRKLVRMSNDVRVPSMRGPTIPVHKGAHFVPINDVPSRLKSGAYKSYVIFGCGKTGADAVVHLLQNGIDQSQITWIVPRDYWYFLRDGLANFWEGTKHLKSPMNECGSAKDVFLAWERSGICGRLENEDAEKRGAIPKVFKGATMDLTELRLMRSVKNVVRMGRAVSVEERTVVLERGTFAYSPEDTLLVDCMVDGLYGYGIGKDFRIFEPGRINMGPITFVFNTCASASHIAFLECALEDDASRNESCYFVRGVPGNDLGSIERMIGNFYLQNKGMERLRKVPGGNRWVMNSRVNLVAPLHHRGGWFRLMWYLFGPERGAASTKRLTEKVESKGFSDIDHCFGAETLGPQTTKQAVGGGVGALVGGGVGVFVGVAVISIGAAVIGASVRGAGVV